MSIPSKDAPRIFLIDAYALIYRSYFAFIKRPLTNAAGENTSAPFGFTRFLLDIRENFDPDYLAVVFDAGVSFRDIEYPEYKATREKMPDDLRASLGRIRDILEGFNDPVVELEGYEADDVIGTLAMKAIDQGLEAVIVSGDKDFYQLIGPGIHLLNPGRGGATGVASEWVTEDNASDKFGIPPSQVADYLALVGDSSDNVPGAPGIGQKTAESLLQHYEDIEELIAHAEELKPPRASKSLQENAEKVRLSKRLVTIMTDLDVQLDLESLKVQEPNNAALRDVFAELGFRRLTEQFSAAASSDTASSEEEPGKNDVSYQILDLQSDLTDLVEDVRASGRVAIASEFTTKDPLVGDLVSLAFSTKSGVASYFPFGHQQAFELTLEGENQEAVENLSGLDSREMSEIKEILEDPEIEKVGHDLKRTALLLARAGVKLRGFSFDVMIASYLFDPGSRDHGVASLALKELSRTICDRKDLVGSGSSQRPFSDVPVEQAGHYLCEVADVLLGLAMHFQQRLEERSLSDLMADLEMPLIPVLVNMELAGIAIDRDFFKAMHSKLVRELDLIGEDIFKHAGGEFNLNSTHQLRQVLFENLNLPIIKRTKTGPSTDASVLEELATQGHALPRLMIDYRELEKLRSTYVDALPQLVHGETGRIHTSFNQAVTTTGRLSSSDPNLQNIPIRTEIGREIRKGFIAGSGSVFLAVDYSQIELRVLAHFSGDAAFVGAFKEGVDVHRQTAAVIFGIPVEEVTPEMRGQAKTVSFATLYGQGAFSLANRLGISRDEAHEFIEMYFERFNSVRKFFDVQIDMAREVGYVETLMGRRRYVPELQASNWSVRQFGERVAQNTPIQGTAADLMKKAMLDVHEALGSANSEARMLLQVHDELLLEVPQDEIEEIRDLVVNQMEGAVELNVPLVAESGVGSTWYECKG